MDITKKINNIADLLSSKMYCKKEIKEMLYNLKDEIQKEFCSDCNYLKQKVIDYIK